MFRLLSVLFLFCIAGPAAALEPINVFVSILPQKFLVEKIGGERVSVSVMVRPGLSPETYEPTPRQMAALENAHLYFRIAVPFESVWIERLQAINKSMRVVPCCGSIDLHDPATFDHPGDHDKHIDDVHVWTSPKNAIVLAGLVKQALVETDPAHSAYYAGNYHELVSELESLHAFIKSELADLPHRFLIVSHPAWGYFAREYDLVQVPIEQQGSEIRAKELTRLIELARRENIKTVFVQKQVNPSSAKILSREIGARVVELDPLAEDYIENLRRVARAIREAASA